MSWSLLNAVMAKDVEEILASEHLRPELTDDERAMKKEECLAVIHAALWAYSSRAGSTASAYAFSNLYDALGLESWKFKERPTHSAGEQR